MIGIFGGTFDPIHFGHLRTVLDVQQALGLEEVRFIPLRDPPHRDPPKARPELRLEMLNAALADQPGFRVDERELLRADKSYTVRTLRSLRMELGNESALCLIVGSDAFRCFPDWYRPEEILQLCHVVVMQRPGDPLPDHYPERLANDLKLLSAAPAGCIWPQPVTQLQISATRIRELLHQGRSPRYLLPDPVLEIIRREGLYRSGE